MCKIYYSIIQASQYPWETFGTVSSAFLPTLYIPFYEHSSFFCGTGILTQGLGLLDRLSTT
jgi:hypothetical protein